MKCIIVDDNKIARSTLSHLAKQVPYLDVIGEYNNALEAYNIIREQKVDLMLLDIQMPGTSGIELVQNLGSKRPVIVFITSKKEFAAEAFDLNVADYIVKPATPVRFMKAMDKAKEIFDASNVKMEGNNDDFLFIREGFTVKKISIDNILFGEAMGDYVKIYSDNSQRYYMVHNTLKVVEERLPKDKFIRVHRSYIVAINKIDTIKEGSLIFGDKAVPVADSFRAALNNRLRIL